MILFLQMNYLSKLFSTGAIRETPEKVKQTLLHEAGTQQVKTVVEIGAGKGELTEALLTNKLRFLHYYAFEIDEKACQNLQFAFPEIILKQENAFEFAAHLPPEEKIDLFLSSIPLSFYSQKKITELLTSIKNSLGSNGKVIIIFTAFWLIPILKNGLPGSKLYSFFTFPPYFLLVYQQQKN